MNAFIVSVSLFLLGVCFQVAALALIVGNSEAEIKNLLQQLALYKAQYNQLTGRK